MDLVKGQIISYWIAIAFFIVSFIFYATSLVFCKEEQKKVANPLVWGGLLFTTIALGLRWAQVGRGPYLDFIEVLPGDAWVAVIIYLILRKVNPRLDILGIFVTPAAFLMLAAALLSDPEVKSAPITYDTYWLYIHIAFAKIAYGSCLVSAAMAGLFLWKSRAEARGEAGYFVGRLPGTPVMNELSHRFAGFAFIMLGVMILTGAIWAHKSWGRYWGWDPIETWALISWFIYGIYLHLRFTFKLDRQKLAWLAVFAFVIVIFAYFITPFLYESIHEHLNK